MVESGDTWKLTPLSTKTKISLKNLTQPSVDFSISTLITLDLHLLLLLLLLLTFPIPPERAILEFEDGF
ncbi:hypothetical protein P8452_57985 [Trifolium repens]|nr:hypothetical protein P8452_57985 [Trifolium repens]